MKAYELLSDFFLGQPIPDVNVLSLTENSSRANENALFVCITGARSDGHDFALDAYRRGCRLFVAQKEIDLPDDAFVYKHSDTRLALSLLATRFYGFPSQKMHLIGITGTKGKTTTAQLLCHILNQSGIPCGYVGTNGISYGDTVQATTNTTPDAITLQKTLCDMIAQGVCTAVIEVSSQAILQSRVCGIKFSTVVFTNLFPDHIGINEHPNFENYKECKHRLFTDFGAENVIFNADDAAALDMIDGTDAKNNVDCSMNRSCASFYATDQHPWKDDYTLGTSFTVVHENNRIACRLPLTGAFNACNALLASAVATQVFSVPLPRALKALENARVAGRMEMLALPNGARAVIDYAHNGESLSKTLMTLREYEPKRLIVLFGSVGERSRLRRAELGMAAAKYTDLAILTSDNPGDEDPNLIISDIAKAFADTETPYLAIIDREEAIRTAVDLTHEGDILLLAGKGHENYQLIGRKKIPFSEKEILLDAIKLQSTI